MAAFLVFGSGKASRLPQASSRNYILSPGFPEGAVPAWRFSSMHGLRLKMRFSQCYISPREKPAKRW